MLRLTLAQMRRSVGRLVAAGVAILIGTAFVTASLLAGHLISTSAYDAIAAQFAKADLVVTPDVQGGVTDATLATVRATDGVAAADGVRVPLEALKAGSRTIYQSTIATASDPALMPLTLTQGSWPTGAHQIAVPADVAKRLDVSVGETIAVEEYSVHESATDDGALDSTSQDVTYEVTGIVADPKRAFARQGGAAVMEAGALAARLAAENGSPAGYDQAVVRVAPGASVEAVRAALAGDLEAEGPGFRVVTPHEQAAASAARLTGGQDVIFLVFVLTFAAIALLVAGLVITNTFQVLVAQRTRTLALLRAVGANKRQVGNGVLLEAGLLGVVASATGVVVGIALGQLALSLARGSAASAFLPTTLSVSWQAVVIPVLVGTLVTVLAALVPARIATRVAPLAALRPEVSPSVEKGSAGRARLVLSTLAALGGFVLLAGGAAAGTLRDDAQVGLLLGVAGGAISFVGVAVSAVFWIPRVASAAGRLVGLSGPTARLAAANTLRNPRRTAATSTALLIGVTLVAMMSTAAATARSSVSEELDQQFPVDVAVETLQDEDGWAPLPASLVDTVESAEGVQHVAEATSAMLTFADRYRTEDGTLKVGTPPAGASDHLLLTTQFYGVDKARADGVLNDATILEGVAPGTISLASETGEALQIDDGDAVQLTGPGGTETLTAHLTGGSVDAPVIDAADMKKLDPQAVTTTTWAHLAPDGLDAVGTIRDAVADADVQATVRGAAAERASFMQVLDTALAIVVGLLAVAVVIALIGVANTLSLSVLERRRESATLRAIGVTRGQLRWMLAVEGMLIAGVGAVLGIVLGIAYGFGGALAALGSMGHVTLTMPWRDVALVAVVALVAGLVASVAPGRSAARPSPVAALATE